MGKAARNERLKISATYCNNLAAAMFAAGFAVPYFSLSTAPNEVVSGLQMAVFVIGMAFSGAFHYVARDILRNTED